MWIPGFGKYTAKEGSRIGDVAFDFTLKDTDGTAVRLSEQVGEKPVVLVFYPKAASPICTKQLCSLKERWDELMEKARVFAISYDSPDVLKRWKEQDNLPMPLLSDSTHEVAKKYGVAGAFANARVSFVIGTDGKIKAVIDSVSAGNHAKQVMDAL